MRYFYIFIFFIFFSLFSKEAENILLNRIDAHFLLEDYFSALKEAENALQEYPESISLNKAYITALAYLGYDLKAVKIINNLPVCLEELNNDNNFIEEIAWILLKKGLDSTQYSTRLSSMLGIYYTHDARAVKVFETMMSDTNAILRSIALELASNYKDEILKKKISSMMDTEKVWIVKLQVLKAIGKMQIREKTSCLKEILKNNKATFEERVLAIEALVNIYENIDEKELNILLDSPYAGFRCLGCELASHFKIIEMKEKILNLVLDPRSDVRISALNAIVLYFKDAKISKEEILKVLKRAYQDTNPFVAITAAWAGLTLDNKNAKEKLNKWLYDKYPEHRRFAASAVAQAGAYGVDLANIVIQKSDDSYVKANIALGLIGQRKNVSKCCDIIYEFIKQKKQMWMWDTPQNSLFRIIAPSEIRHTDQLPNYPEAIDQVVQLNMLSILAILEDTRAQDAIKSFLKRKTWGITGLAAITLLQEGDEESLKVLRSLLEDKEKNIRIQAALALAVIGKDKSALPILEEAYVGADHEMKLNILGAIGNISNQESLPFLIKILEEPFQIIKIAAASAIIQTINL